MELSFPAIDAAAHIRDFRNNYVNFNGLAKNKALPAVTSLLSPSQQAILDVGLPPALLDAMAEFQKNNAGGRALTPVKYMKIVDGVPVLVIEDESPLPAEEDIATFSHTVTSLSLGSAKVVTHNLVATMASSGREIA
jgi:hypothetical protein